MTKPLTPENIQRFLDNQIIAREIIRKAQVGSTNDELKRLAELGAPEGLLYIAEAQTAGRGRLSRRWSAPAGSSLLMSILFRPGDWLAPDQIGRITMLTALALVEAIEAELGLSPRIKWPNDLIWHDGRKLAGILTEVGFNKDRVAWLVVGIGLNVNLQATDFADPVIAQRATSLAMLTGRPIDRLPLLQQFLAQLEQRYLACQQDDVPTRAWRDRLAYIGQPVSLHQTDGTILTGTLHGVTEAGALQLIDDAGQLQTHWAGDVSLRAANSAITSESH